MASIGTPHKGPGSDLQVASFFTLSYEIRCQIYRNVFSGLVVQVTPEGTLLRNTLANVRRSCRIISEEATSVYMSNAVFELSSPEALDHLSALQEPHRACSSVRRLLVNQWGEPNNLELRSLRDTFPGLSEITLDLTEPQSNSRPWITWWDIKMVRTEYFLITDTFHKGAEDFYPDYMITAYVFHPDFDQWAVQMCYEIASGRADAKPKLMVRKILWADEFPYDKDPGDVVSGLRKCK